MELKIRGQEVEVKFTFNSFKYMEDFDLSVMEEIETKPFKLIPVVETLLVGALNNNPKVKYTPAIISEFLEEYVVENSIGDLLEELMVLLQESNFFKSLQKNQPAEAKKAKAKK